ncbi:MAG: septum site-determining protein MinC [Clostridiales bacterium]
MNKAFWEDSISPRPTMMIKRTLRSGQNVNYDGNIVILGDVNPGAELTASGNILVMGSLRGVVHAGADGDEESWITALFLDPTQLRIGAHITRPPDGNNKDEHFSLPETARIKDNEVIIERYQINR